MDAGNQIHVLWKSSHGAISPAPVLFPISHSSPAPPPTSSLPQGDGNCLLVQGRLSLSLLTLLSVLALCHRLSVWVRGGPQTLLLQDGKLAKLWRIKGDPSQQLACPHPRPSLPPASTHTAFFPGACRRGEQIPAGDLIIVWGNRFSLFPSFPLLSQGYGIP